MSKDLPPSRTADQFVVRFPEGMRDQIAERAKQNSRSMNAEIVARLEESLAKVEASDEQAFQEGLQLGAAQLEIERLKKERMQFFQDRASSDTVGKLLQQLPAELVSQYGLHLYRSEFDRAQRERDEAAERFSPVWDRHQELLREGGPPGPLMRSKEAVSTLQRRIHELGEQMTMLNQTISGIHTYREVHGLPELRDVQRVFSTVAGGAEPLSLGKPAMVLRKDGAVTPFEPPEEHPVAAPPASQGPERLRRQVNRRRST